MYCGLFVGCSRCSHGLQPKFQGLFGALGYGSRVIDCLASNNEDAMKALELAFEDRALLAGEVAAGNRLAKEKVDIYVNEVSMVLDGISQI